LFPQSGLKLVGHLVGSAMIAFVFIRATKGGFLTASLVLPVTIGTLALGALCTYGFHGLWGDDPNRFTSFMPAQGYASFLAALYCIALTGKGLDVRLRVVLCSALAVALMLNGSRIWFTGILLASILALLISDGQVWLKLITGLLMTTLIAVLIAMPGQAIRFLAKDAATNRIASAVTAAYTGNNRSTGLGTLNFRREVYRLALQRIGESTPVQLLIGRGTCNGAVITGSLFYGYSKYNDPNRMFHNEWLRVLYEWGLIGSACWLAFMGSIIKLAWVGCRYDKGGSARPLLVYLPAFMVGLWGENILAGAGSAVSVGFLWAVALATMSHRDLETRRSLQRALLRLRPIAGLPRRIRPATAF
jgi:hypothetical protein